MILLLITSWITLSGAFTFIDPSIYEPELDTYFGNDFIGEALDFLQSEYPDLVQPTSLGETVHGREIYAVTITKNVSYWQTHNRPSVKYMANMHGNEIRGRGLLMKLAYYLTTQYSVDDSVKNIVDSTIFHLVPTINPDGFASAVPTCSGVTGRYTSQGVDMNRDFPNHWSTGEKMKYAAETLLVMEYAKTITPVLGISFHDGALVTNYPWDGQPDLYTGQYAKSPDDSLFIELAKSYTFAHASMYDTSKQCTNDNFKDGITNGNMWYKVFNGMQDWNYVDMDCFEVTIELGCCKYPADPKSTYKSVWSDNFKSLFEFTAKAHQTIRGRVSSWDGTPILGVTIEVEGIDKDITVRHPSGFYWRPLQRGVYNITASKTGYFPLTYKNIVVKEGESTVVNFILISRNQADGEGDNEKSGEEGKESDQNSGNNNEDPKDSGGAKLIPGISLIFLQTIILLMTIRH